MKGCNEARLVDLHVHNDGRAMTKSARSFVHVMMILDRLRCPPDVIDGYGEY
jgi:hypothetical protein